MIFVIHLLSAIGFFILYFYFLIHQNTLFFKKYIYKITRYYRISKRMLTFPKVNQMLHIVKLKLQNYFFFKFKIEKLLYR